IALGELPNQREARATTMPDSSGAEGTDVPRLGLTVVPAGQVAGSGSEGVGVTEVDPNGIASAPGVKNGDVILGVGGKKGANPAGTRGGLREGQRDGKRRILRGGRWGGARKFVARRLGRAGPNGAPRRHPPPPPAVRTGGTGPAPVPIPSNFVPASVAPAGAELVEGWRVKPPPLAFLGLAFSLRPDARTLCNSAAMISAGHDDSSPMDIADPTH